MGGTLRLMFTGMAFGSLGLSGLFINLISMRFSVYSFYIYMSMISLLVTNVCYLYFVESPFYFYKQRDIKKLYQCLMTICKRNFTKKELPSARSRLQKALRFGPQVSFSGSNSETKDPKQIESTEFEDKDSTEEVSESSMTPKHPSSQIKSKFPFRLFLQKPNFFKFLKVIFIFFQLEMVFGLGIIINKDLGISNIYLSGSLVCVFQTLGFLGGSFIVPKFKRRTVNMSSSLIICALSSLLLVVDLISNRSRPYSERSDSVRLVETGELDQ